jgi:hypothetical protein
MTKAVAQEKMRRWRDDQKLPKTESSVQHHVRRWCRDFIVRVNQATADAKEAKSTDPEVRQVLRDTIEPGLLPQLKKAIEEWTKLLSDLEQLVQS